MHSSFIKMSSVKNIAAGVVIFFCFYRVAFLNPMVLLNIPIGLFGFILILHRGALSKILSNIRLRNFIAITVTFILYLILIDFYHTSDSATLRNLFSIRLLSLLLLSAACAYGVEHLTSKGSFQKLNTAFLYCIAIQFFFFCFMYYSPELKFPIYSIFGMQDSPNLFDWNITERGFGVGSEINFTAPMVTAIAAILLIKSNVLKLLLIAAQIANTTIAIFSLIFYSKYYRQLAFALVIFGVLYGGYFDTANIIESILPRLSRELASGFTITLYELLDRHIIYQGKSIVDLLFGTGINLLPEAGKDYSSDIGWIIMLNYAGVVCIILFILFLIHSISLTPFSRKIKLLLFICACILNTKGLLFGPNSFFFFIFIFASNSLRRSYTNKAIIYNDSLNT